MLKKNKQLRTIKFILMTILMFVLLIVLHIKENDILEKERYKDDIGKFNKQEYDYVFLGDSITFRNDWKYFYPHNTLINSGIDGNTTEQVLQRLEADVFFYQPKKVILLIGVNDIARQIDVSTIVDNVDDIVKKIKKELPNTEIYLESIYPVNNVRFNRSHSKIKNEKILEINNHYKNIADKYDITYIDMYSHLTDEEGNLNVIYSKDGLHLSLQGYIAVTEVLNNYILDKEEIKK